MDTGTEDFQFGSSDDENSQVHSRVFWCVNAFLFTMLAVAILWCRFGDKSCMTASEERRQSSDEEYQQTLRQRLENQAKARLDTPEKRTAKLLKSFRRHKVEMTVREEDLVPGSKFQVDLESQNNTASEECEASTSSENDAGHLRLAPSGMLVPNCCAVCLGDYSVGDDVVWSSNPECGHAFHKDCIVGWLVKMQPETPCPCCRQEFTDLETVRKEAKIIWSSGNTFNLRSISL